jgi:hypothetical protein
LNMNYDCSELGAAGTFDYISGWRRRWSSLGPIASVDGSSVFGMQMSRTFKYWAIGVLEICKTTLVTIVCRPWGLCGRLERGGHR